MRKRDFFSLGAAVFGLWALANTTLTVARYGLDQGMYLWFCNVALWATAYGLWRRDRGLLLAFLGVALFTQPLYIVDSLWHLATGHNLFGAAEFMYQPGMPMIEFLLSRYHYFVIPATAFALCQLPRRQKERTYLYIVVFNVVLFGLSYFVFPRAQNVNCIHEACFDDLSFLRGPRYSLGFFVLVLAGNLSMSRFLDWGLGKVAESPARLPVRKFYVTITAAGLVLAGVDLAYKRRIPRLDCAGRFEDSGVKVDCLYTLEYGPKILDFIYSIENKLDVAQYCDTRLDLYGEYETLHEALYLKPRERMQLTAKVMYPEKDTTGKIAASCLRLQ